MSSQEQTPREADLEQFRQITNGVTLPTAWLKWPTLSMKGQTIFVNAESGTQFRDAVRTREIELGHGPLPEMNVRSTQGADVTSQNDFALRGAKAIDNGLAGFLLHGQEILKLGGMVAVTGLGLVDAFKNPKSTTRKPRLLDGENVVFGFIHSLGFKRHSTLDPDTLAKLAAGEEDEDFPYEMGIEQEGAVLRLDNALECELSDEGTFTEKLGRVAVPMNVDTLILHEAHRIKPHRLA